MVDLATALEGVYGKIYNSGQPYAKLKVSRRGQDKNSYAFYCNSPRCERGTINRAELRRRLRAKECIQFYSELLIFDIEALHGLAYEREVATQDVPWVLQTDLSTSLDRRPF